MSKLEVVKGEAKINWCKQSTKWTNNKVIRLILIYFLNFVHSFKDDIVKLIKKSRDWI